MPSAPHPGIRLMYWPNEPLLPDGWFRQVGGRHAFEAMQHDGTLAALEIYSYRERRSAHASASAFEEQAIADIRRFSPDIVYVQHLIGTDLPESLWRRLRAEFPKTTLVFHEADPFDRVAKRIDAPTRAIIPHAHLVLISGLGDFSKIFAFPGGPPVELKPQGFPREHFALHDPLATPKTHDIVMIANRGNRRRLRFLYVPGGRRRARFALALSDLYGPRFALYGKGWSALSSARGSLPYFAQEQAIQSGRISANWDHFDHIDYYYSDRLPISLAAGVPHVTSYHRGYDQLFRGCPGFYACRSVAEAVETCRWLTSRPDRELVEEGLAARQWALDHLETDILFRRAYEQSLRAHQARLGAAV